MYSVHCKLFYSVLELRESPREAYEASLDNLNQLPKIFNISKHTFLTIKQNLFWAFSYNLIAIPIAAIMTEFIAFELDPVFI